MKVPLLITLFAIAIGSAVAATLPTVYLNHQCGSGKGKCAGSLCCSKYGYCGATSEHCGSGCKSGYGRCGILKAKLYTKCSVSGTFAVTFDDGPTALTSGLLDYLKSVSVKATFFMNGNNWKNIAPDYPNSITKFASTVQRAYNEGHQICSHTWGHVDLLTVDEYNITTEMLYLEQSFQKILGFHPNCMRPPYGDSDNNALGVLGALGYHAINWNTDGMDWYYNNNNKSMADYKEELGSINPKTYKGGFIALNHDKVLSTAGFAYNPPKNDPPLARQLIEYVKSKGFTLTTVAGCLGMNINNIYNKTTLFDQNDPQFDFTDEWDY